MTDVLLMHEVLRGKRAFSSSSDIISPEIFSPSLKRFKNSLIEDTENICSDSEANQEELSYRSKKSRMRNDESSPNHCYFPEHIASSSSSCPTSFPSSRQLFPPNLREMEEIAQLQSKVTELELSNTSLSDENKILKRAVMVSSFLNHPFELICR
jgi:hypothetical protein